MTSIQVRVGRSIAAADPATTKQLFHAILMVNMSIGIALAFLCYFMRHHVVRIYTQDDDLIELVVSPTHRL